MKRTTILVLFAFQVSLHGLYAQWVVTDPTNLAQGIINSVNQVAESASTKLNTLNNFQETAKIFEQGKKYYDALKSVNNLVKDARKVQECVLMLNEIAGIYVDNFQRMLADPYYTASELEAIASGYVILLKESNNVIEDLKQIINPTTLSLSDKERMDIIDSCHRHIREYKSLVIYYTNKNIRVSYLRAKKKGDLAMIIELYGVAEKYW